MSLLLLSTSILCKHSQRHESTSATVSLHTLQTFIEASVYCYCLPPYSANIHRSKCLLLLSPSILCKHSQRHESTSAIVSLHTLQTFIEASVYFCYCLPPYSANIHRSKCLLLLLSPSILCKHSQRQVSTAIVSLHTLQTFIEASVYCYCLPPYSANIHRGKCLLLLSPSILCKHSYRYVSTSDVVDCLAGLLAEVSCLASDRPGFNFRLQDGSVSR